MGYSSRSSPAACDQPAAGVSGGGNAFDVLMPGAVMAVVPIIIVYLFAQKTFIAGLTSGSVKG